MSSKIRKCKTFRSSSSSKYKNVINNHIHLCKREISQLKVNKDKGLHKQILQYNKQILKVSRNISNKQKLVKVVTLYNLTLQTL